MYYFFKFWVFLFVFCYCDKDKKKILKPFNEILLNYAKKRNIEFSNKIKINFTSINYKSFYSIEDISINETILKVPLKSILTAELIKNNSPEFLLNIYSDMKNKS